MRLKLLCLALGAVFLLLTGFRPDTVPYVPKAGFSDAAISHLPSALYLRESVLERGTFPVWRTTVMMGEPFAANPLNKTAYPLQWLVLLLPPALHLDVMIVLHLLIAGWGMGRWARGLGLRREAAAFSALAYALSPKLIAHTGAGHLDFLYALAWTPWLLDAVRRAVTGQDSRLASVLRVSLFGALVLLCDVRMSLFAYGTAGAFALYTAAQGRTWRKLGRLIAAAPLVLVMTASVVVPLLGWRPFMTRAGLSPADAGIFSLDFAKLGGIFALPMHIGIHEHLTYLGLPVLILAVFALANALRRHGFWGALIAFTVLYALGSNGFLWRTLVGLVPALLWYRVPSRAWFVIVLAAALLAGYGLDMLLTMLEERRARALRRGRLFALIGLVAAGVGGVLLIAVVPPLRGTAVNLLVGGAAFALVLALAFAGRLSRSQVTVLVMLVLFADVAWFGRLWMTWRGEEHWLAPHVPLMERLVAEAPTGVYTPFYSARDSITVNVPQEVAEVYGLRVFGGVDPFQLTGLVDAIIRGSRVEATGYDVMMPPSYPIDPEAPDPLTPDTQVLAAWDVSHVVSAFPIDDARLELLDTVDGVSLYANRDFTAPSTNQWGWAAGWQGLPDDATVERLNQQTVSAALVSGTAFALCVVLLVVVSRRANGR